MKFCKDCKHANAGRYMSDGKLQVSLSPIGCKRIRDPVHGYPVSATVQRSLNGECGPDAKHWEEYIPPPKKRSWLIRLFEEE
jgi:hypothetical protein